MGKASSPTTPVVVAGLAIASTLVLALLIRKTWWSSTNRREEGARSTSHRRRRPGERNMERFEEACMALESAGSDLPDSSRLELYALYKQAVEGDCEQEEPFRLKAVAHAKWSAWRSKKGLASDAAKEAYVRLALDLGVLRESSEATSMTGGGRFIRSVCTVCPLSSVCEFHLQLGPVHSRPVMADKPDGNITSKGDRICCLAAEGDLDSIKAALAADSSLVNGTGEGRMTALHFAADRGFVDIVKLLIASGANLNHADDSGETPLHVAIAADQDEIIAILVDAGADLSIRNNEGLSCAELLEQNKASQE
ncbi:hypothetical protein Efla_002604 [Eimeria flavescens]